MPASHDPRDVRMRGFPSRSTVEEAWAWLDAQLSELPAETVSIEQAFERILAADIVSPIDVPAFDRAAMDGYALRAEETIGASDYSPVVFRVIGESLPGRPSDLTVSSNEAVRIMTGAPMPAGADAVVPAEMAQEAEGRVEVAAAVASFKHLGRVGEDVRRGDVIVARGRRLRPQDLGVIASVGMAEVRAVCQPRVRVLITGNELVAAGQPRGPYQIYEANSLILRGLVSRDGGLLESVRRVQDQREAIAEALTEAGADVILVSGGSSVGAEDHAPGLLRELGELAIHGVAMRPSSPAGMGKIGNTLVFLLPGNPVSCLCAYDFFAGRAVRSLGGQNANWPYRSLTGRLLRKISSAIGRVDYCRVRLSEEGIEPLSLTGAAILSSTTRADGFVIIPAMCEGYDEGTEVEVWRYDG